MAKQKSVFRRMGDSIKAGASAVVDVAQAAITSAGDLPEGGGYKPVGKQRWAQEVEATGAKKARKKSRPKKKAAKKAPKKAVKKTAKKSKNKSRKKKL
jgi:hypothetical protein